MTSANSPRIDKRRRTYVRLIGEIHHALNSALAEEKLKRGLTKTAIGEMLGLGRSAISKKFDGRQNFTLETLADLAFSLDRSVKVILSPRPAAYVGNNAAQDDVKPPLASMSSALTVPTVDLQNASAAYTPAPAVSRQQLNFQSGAGGRPPLPAMSDRVGLSGSNR